MKAFLSAISRLAHRPLPVFLLVAAGWIVLGFLGFPPPMEDDLAYGGPGVHLALGHGLSNPWMGLLDPVGNRFLFYPPFYFYLHAAWLKVFGISTGTMIGFQIACILATSGVLALFLRRWGAAAWLQLPLAFLQMVALASCGFRPDACAFALFALGAWFELGLGKTWRGPGAFLLVASAFALPLTGVWTAVLFAYRLLELRRQPAPVKEGLLLLARFALAGGLSLLLFYAAIGGRVAAFRHDFAACGGDHLFYVVGYYLHNWQSATLLIRCVALPGLLLGVGAVFLFGELGKGTDPARRTALWSGTIAALLFLGVDLLFVASSASVIRSFCLSCAMGTAVLAWLGWHRRRSFAFLWIAPALLAAVLFSGVYSRAFLGWALAERPDPARIAALKAEAADLVPKADRLLIDSDAARLIYDYRLPPQTKDVNWIAWPHVGWRMTELPPGSFTVAILSSVDSVYIDTHEYSPLYLHPHPVHFLGHEVPHTAANRNRLFLLQNPPPPTTPQE